MQKPIIAAAAAAGLIALSARAEDNGWSGEGSISAGMTSGNTETTDIGVGVDFARTTQIWTLGLEALADYGETDGEETKNRFFLAGQLDRQLRDRLYGFGRLSYERDEFSGFESRTFLGTGLGYQILDGAHATWSVESGPGLKIDEVRPAETMNDLGAPVTIPGTTEESLSFIAVSHYAYQFNDAVQLTNETDAIYADESTQLTNIVALTADLTEALSARISFDVRHDTNPPDGFENTDTATRFSLVYAIG